MRASFLSTSAAALATAALVTAAPAAADDFAGYRGLAVAPGVAEPRPAAPGTVWRQFEPVAPGAQRDDARGNFGLQVMGSAPAGPVLCEVPHSLPSIIGVCVAGGREATHLGWNAKSDVVTFDPVLGFLAPVLRSWHWLQLQWDLYGSSSRA